MLKTTKKAFTLLELIVVLLVLGILAALAVPVYTEVKQQSLARTAFTTAQAIARDANAIAAADGSGGVTTNADIDAAAAETSLLIIDESVLEPTSGWLPVGVYGNLAGNVYLISGSTWCIAYVVTETEFNNHTDMLDDGYDPNPKSWTYGTQAVAGNFSSVDDGEGGNIRTFDSAYDADSSVTPHSMCGTMP